MKEGKKQLILKMHCDAVGWCQRSEKTRLTWVRAVAALSENFLSLTLAASAFRMLAKKNLTVFLATSFCSQSCLFVSQERPLMKMFFQRAIAPTSAQEESLPP